MHVKSHRRLGALVAGLLVMGLSGCSQPQSVSPASPQDPASFAHASKSQPAVSEKAPQPASLGQLSATRKTPKPPAVLADFTYQEVRIQDIERYLRRDPSLPLQKRRQVARAGQSLGDENGTIYALCDLARRYYAKNAFQDLSYIAPYQIQESPVRSPRAVSIEVKGRTYQLGVLQEPYDLNALGSLWEGNQEDFFDYVQESFMGVPDPEWGQATQVLTETPFDYDEIFSLSPYRMKNMRIVIDRAMYPRIEQHLRKVQKELPERYELLYALQTYHEESGSRQGQPDLVSMQSKEDTPEQVDLARNPYLYIAFADRQSPDEPLLIEDVNMDPVQRAYTYALRATDFDMISAGLGEIPYDYYETYLNPK